MAELGATMMGVDLRAIGSAAIIQGYLNLAAAAQ